ncbi:MAG: nucleotide exchange factor GrpE [Oscillospiraceae bacterium]|nr:nucleotide exchange factor GrpE [Oscillospiraceae bacterium]
MDFLEELLKLSKLPLDFDVEDEFKSIDAAIIYDEINKNIVKINKSQKEISYNMEEVNEFIQEYKDDYEDEIKRENDSLLKGLISIADVVEDFYVFCLSFGDDERKTSGEMIWNSILKKLSLSGLVRIFDEKTKPDAVFNTVISTSEDLSLPEGYIIKTVKSGYIYKNKVIRKSSVIVNKLENKEIKNGQNCWN